MKKFLKVASILLIIILVFLFIVQARLDGILKRAAVEFAKREMGLNISFEDADVNIFLGRVKLTSFKILKNDGSDLLKSDYIIAAVSYQSLLKEIKIVDAFVIGGLDITINVDKAGKVDLKEFVENLKSKQAKKEAAVYMKEIRLVEGKINFRDGEISQIPHLTTLSDINLLLVHVGHGKAFGKDYFNYKISCKINPEDGGTLNSKGKIFVGGGGVNFNAGSTISKMNLLKFGPYYKDIMSLKLERGFVTVQGTAECKNNILDSKNKAVFEDISVEKTGDVTALSFGLSAQTVMEFLKDKHGKLEVEFKVVGDIRHPEFDMQIQVIDAASMAITGVINKSLRLIKDISGKTMDLGIKASEKAIDVGEKATYTAIDTTKAVRKGVTDAVKSIIPFGGRKEEEQIK